MKSNSLWIVFSCLISRFAFQGGIFLSQISCHLHMQGLDFTAYKCKRWMNYITYNLHIRVLIILIVTWKATSGGRKAIGVKGFGRYAEEALLAFIEGGQEDRAHLAPFIPMGATSVLIWDIVNNLLGDCRLLRKSRIRLPIVTYFVSRFSCLLYIIGCVIFDTAPINECAKWGRILDWAFPVVVSSTSFLFLLRVRAVFQGNPFVIALFTFTWLAVVGGTVTVGLGLQAGNIGASKYCYYTSLKTYISASIIIPLVNDTLVFVAITWRLMRNAYIEYDLAKGLKTAVFGKYLPAFSKALLHDGQIYYLAIVTSSLLSVIILYIPSIAYYKITFTIPNVVLMNIMACRVYRNTRFASRKEKLIPLTIENLRFTREGTDNPNIGLSMTRNQAHPRHETTSYGIESGFESHEKAATVDMLDASNTGSKDVE